MSTPAPTTAPEYWTCDVVLVGGGTVRVRPIEPEDPPALVAFHSTFRGQVPLDRAALPESVRRTRRLLVVDEDYRSFGMS